jgi:membrane protease subunit HflK
MERILGGSEKLVYDGGNSAQSNIVPYLPLSELTPRRPAPAAGQQQSGGTR